MTDYASVSDDLVQHLKEEANKSLIEDIRAGARAWPAIVAHEQICALRWRWVQRLLIVMLVVQLLQLLGIPAKQIGLAVIHVFGGG